MTLLTSICIRWLQNQGQIEPLRLVRLGSQTFSVFTLCWQSILGLKGPGLKKGDCHFVWTCKSHPVFSEVRREKVIKVIPKSPSLSGKRSLRECCYFEDVQWGDLYVLDPSERHCFLFIPSWRHKFCKCVDNVNVSQCGLPCTVLKSCWNGKSSVSLGTDCSFGENPVFRKPVIKQNERKHRETQSQRPWGLRGFYDNLRLPFLLTQTAVVQDESVVQLAAGSACRSVNIVVGSEDFVMVKMVSFVDKGKKNKTARQDD